MNILIDALPTSLYVDGQEVPIRSSFRDSLRALMAYEDNDLTSQEKQMILLANIYYEVPENIPEAIKQAVWFLDGGKDDTESSSDSVRVMSWNKDASLIFAAFRQTHGIDLTTADLHWWQFLALFMDMGQDTAFCQLTSLRSRVKKGKATKEEREAARNMGDAFDVPDLDTRTLEEKEKDALFNRLLGAR